VLRLFSPFTGRRLLRLLLLLMLLRDVMHSDKPARFPLFVLPPVLPSSLPASVRPSVGGFVCRCLLSAIQIGGFVPRNLGWLAGWTIAAITDAVARLAATVGGTGVFAQLYRPYRCQPPSLPGLADASLVVPVQSVI